MSFRVENKELIVSLSLKSSDQIFDLRDPAPFREKDLDQDFARYLVVAIDEADDVNKVRLNLDIPQANFSHFKPSDVQEAVRDYFSFEVQSTTADIQSTLEEGRWALILGTLFLFMCQAVNFWIESIPGFFFETFRQGLQILGWVALWRPMNLLMYEWWPHFQKRKLFNKLSELTVEIIYNDLKLHDAKSNDQKSSPKA